MHATPQKISLISQTQAVLLEGIRERRWQDELPGERVLSRELRISRWTLRAALEELRRSGLVKISQGTPCVITPQALRGRRYQPAPRRVALLVPAPLSKLRLFVSLYVDELRIILNENNIQLNVCVSANAYRSNPKHALKVLVDGHPNHDWLLVLSTRAMQEWFEARSEFVLIAGTRFEDIDLPAIDVAGYAAGVHAAHTLLRLGHRRIAYFTPLVSPAGILATGAGLKNAIGKAQYAETNLVVVACKEDPAHICSALDRVLAEANPPTVLVGARAAFMLTAFSHLMRLKLRVPQDVSLLSIEWEPFLDLVIPRIAHYEISPEQLARQFARVFLRSTVANAEPTYLMPQFFDGPSLRRLPR